MSYPVALVTSLLAGLILATVTAPVGVSGAVFLLPAAAWDALIQSGEKFNPLPANVFAPVH